MIDRARAADDGDGADPSATPLPADVVSEPEDDDAAAAVEDFLERMLQEDQE